MHQHHAPHSQRGSRLLETAPDRVSPSAHLSSSCAVFILYSSLSFSHRTTSRDSSFASCAQLGSSSCSPTGGILSRLSGLLGGEDSEEAFIAGWCKNGSTIRWTSRVLLADKRALQLRTSLICGLSHERDTQHIRHDGDRLLLMGYVEISDDWLG